MVVTQPKLYVIRNSDYCSGSGWVFSAVCNHDVMSNRQSMEIVTGEEVESSSVFVGYYRHHTDTVILWGTTGTQQSHSNSVCCIHNTESTLIYWATRDSIQSQE